MRLLDAASCWCDPLFGSQTFAWYFSPSAFSDSVRIVQTLQFVWSLPSLDVCCFGKLSCVELLICAHALICVAKPLPFYY
jgi:hypothetical protein